MDINISFLSLKALAVKLDIFSRIKLERKQVFLDKVRRIFYGIYEKHVRDWRRATTLLKNCSEHRGSGKLCI